MSAVQINVEYFFRLLYNLIYGTNAAPDYAALAAFIAKAWFVVTVAGYTLSIGGFFVIIYATARLFELREREREYYRTVLVAPETPGGMNPRWRHIESLMERGGESAWREAIVEADIMLGDMLDRQGYAGASVGEKLKNVEPSDFSTLDDAWEAHKVRNQIAHEGSAFDLSETIARRTLAHYEAVFREFEVI